ncbi:hypothetical protein AB434_2105 [Heyndrickxia coagulans]|nr:hypothetical protein AB434_2105 [Heyndrickxia coagulans]
MPGRYPGRLRNRRTAAYGRHKSIAAPAWPHIGKLKQT